MSRSLVPTGQQPSNVRITVTNDNLVPLALNDENVLEVMPSLQQKLTTCRITLSEEDDKGSFKLDFVLVIVCVTENSYIFYLSMFLSQPIERSTYLRKFLFCKLVYHYFRIIQG